MEELDVVIVGGGAAGLSAALLLTRARRHVAVIDAGEPRNAPASHMHGFLSRDGMPPSELLASGRAEIAGYGGQIIRGRVTHIERTSTGFEIQHDSGPGLTARQLLVTTGLRDDIPDISGLRDRWGRDVLHCPYCHGYEVRDRPLAVLGGSPQAVEHALLIRQWSADLLLFAHSQQPNDEERSRLAARGIGIVEGRVTELVVKDDRLHGIVLENGRVTSRAAVFVRPDFVPNSDLLLNLGCAADGDWVTADALGRTSVPGVWVAGNVSNPRAQVITAAGEGSTAAIAINAALVEDDVHSARKEHDS